MVFYLLKTFPYRVVISPSLVHPQLELCGINKNPVVKSYFTGGHMYKTIIHPCYGSMDQPADGTD